MESIPTPERFGLSLSSIKYSNAPSHLLISHILEGIELLCGGQGKHTRYPGRWERVTCGSKESRHQALLSHIRVEVTGHLTQTDCCVGADSTLRGKGKEGSLRCGCRLCWC